MPAQRPSRPQTARVLSSALAKDIETSRALQGIDAAVREEQADPKLPRTGGPGDLFYRAQDGRIVSLPIGEPGQTLRVNAQGFPEWS